MASTSEFFFGSGVTTKVWASGMTVAQWQVVISPLDGDEYRRVTATSGGATDPADDVVNYVARSYRRLAGMPAGIVVGGASGTINAYFKGATKTTVGAIGAGVRTSALSITGRGSIDYLGAIRGATGDFRVEILVDGRTVRDETQTVQGTDTLLYVGAPAWDGASIGTASAIPAPGMVVFRRSFQVFFTAISAAAGAGCGIAYTARSDA